ncbi:MAG: enoyl-CoA hydratase/isomerase family protein [Desulfobacterium sp.]|nr:enoyl-CoA hydratase/isomerase family protein [Desulfobacterium sp.]
MLTDFKTLMVELNDEIAIIKLNNPPVNQLSTLLRTEMAKAFEAAFVSTRIKGIVLTGIGKNFMAGGDITEMAKITDSLMLFEQVMAYNRFQSMIENGPKPVVAAINGPALGGGLELAMACHYRVAATGVKVGQPEVQLGLIPGAGGTQRLARLCGLETALSMITTGKPIAAEKALEQGIVDGVFPLEELLHQAVLATKSFVRKERALSAHRTRNKKKKLPSTLDKQAIINIAAQIAAKKAKGLGAPFKAMEALSKGLSDDFDSDIQREAQLFCECALSPEAKNLISIFINSRKAGRLERTRTVTPKAVKTVAMLGLGVMGAGIVNLLLGRGFKAVLWDVDQGATAKGLERVRKTFAFAVKKGRMTQEALDGLIADNAVVTTDLDDIKGADLVIEAVVENMDIKKALWAKVDQICGPDTVFATNTSALPVTELAAHLGDPGRMLGLHFFNPAERMQLVEVITAQTTSDMTLATGVAFSKRIGKIPVVVNDGPGFYTSRQLNALMGESNFMLEQGIPLPLIDKALTEFGMPMGAFTLHDLTGIDIGFHVANYFEKEFGDRWKVAEIHKKIFETGCYGRKTGAGYYDYADKKPVPNKIVEALVATHLEKSDPQGLPEVTWEILAKRMLARAINEAAFMMDEGICDNRPQDMDLAMVYGCGYPAVKGGVFREADTWGIGNVYDYLLELEAEFGQRFSPSPLLRSMAESSKTFYSTIQGSDHG